VTPYSAARDGRGHVDAQDAPAARSCAIPAGNATASAIFSSSPAAHLPTVDSSAARGCGGPSAPRVSAGLMPGVQTLSGHHGDARTRLQKSTAACDSVVMLWQVFDLFLAPVRDCVDGPVFIAYEAQLAGLKGHGFRSDPQKSADIDAPSRKTVKPPLGGASTGSPDALRLFTSPVATRPNRSRQAHSLPDRGRP
jgi:hypothetical protein